MTTDSPDLTIAIVNWNAREYLECCLGSIPAGLGAATAEVYVVDNASNDGSPALVRERFGDVRLIENDRNVGFAAANNEVIERARGSIVMLLNPDTVVIPGALERIVRYFNDHARLGALGAHLVNQDGSTQASVRDFPTFRSAFYQYTILRVLPALRGAYRRYKMRDFDYETTSPVPQPMGAALAIRKTVLDDVGPMDTGFFMYYEEADLCRRILARGWEIHYLADARITHVGGISAKQAKGALFLHEKKSLLRFFDKHCGRARTMVFRIVFKPLFIAKVLLDIPLDLISALHNARRGRDYKSMRKRQNARMKAVFLLRDLPRFLIA